MTLTPGNSIKYVLTFDKDQNMKTNYYSITTKNWLYLHWRAEITHWMDLPEPPTDKL